ncbi:MAG TPA: DUF4097 family beta strand repeat-containing protein [Chitinophagaceae bacterium]|nr:DUF4097 family beta strand repeat-containing protein [Chitinophagaceae bacterium]
MKTIRIFSVLLCTILFTGKILAQQSITVPLSDPGKSYKLDVGLLDGSIKITGYEGKDIIVDVQTDSTRQKHNQDGTGVNVNTSVNVDLTTQKHSEEGSNAGMRRINGGNSIDLSATEKDNTVSINSGFARKNVTVIIKVPQTTASFKIGTVNNGNIYISNVNGTLEVTNVNGEIVCNNISGSVVANTVNGKVLVTFKSIDPKAAMAFSTLNGNVDVTLPADAKANMKLKSDRGEIYTDFDMAIDKSQPKTNVSNEGGYHHISIEDWVYGKIGGGGPEIMMKNMQGNIYVRKAK